MVFREGVREAEPGRKENNGTQDMTQSVQQETGWHVRNFEALASANGVTPLRDIRQGAFERFREMGFPTLKHEDWKYTNVAPLSRRSFVRASGGATITLEDLDGLLPPVSGPRLIFVNGAFSGELSSADTVDGLTVSPLSSVLDGGGDGADRDAVEKHLSKYANLDEKAFVALNTAFLEDAAFVRVARNVSVEESVHIVFVTTDADLPADEGLAVHPRVLVVAESGSELTVIESHIGLGGGLRFSNPVSEVVVMENARVDHFKVQLETDETYHVGSIHVEQARDSRYTSNSFMFGGLLIRNDIDPVLDGEGCESNLNGLFVLGDSQHCDTHTIIDHAKPHCNSNELYKGILAGKSRGVFSGRIIVRKDAQKTNAFQSNKNLLLSGDASVDSKPQLEIYADDVKCSHGATVGQIDTKALFYLRTRGIDEVSARTMLVRAFAIEILDPVRNRELATFLEDLLIRSLEKTR